MKVTVLTTSYPRTLEDVAGRFVADAVEHVRRRGVEVEVVSPLGYRHYGIAYGSGVVGNLRRRPARALLLPLMLAGLQRAAWRASRDADLVHAHWLPLGGIAMRLGRPFVVQLWGTDVELARRAPWLFRPLLRRARLVVVASEFLEQAARELGAREVRVIPSGVEIPDTVGEPDDPPHVLFVGRLSPEKGIHEFLRATKGLRRVIVGAGPVRVTEALGFVPHAELGPYYERAAVVCVPSRREGYGFVAHEAMAYGRPVVATRVGGLVDAIEDGVSGLLVDAAGLRPAVERLLADPELRARLSAAARKHAIENFKGGDIRSAYEEALSR